MTTYINLFHRKNQSVIVSSGITKTKKYTFRFILIMLLVAVCFYSIHFLLTEEIKKHEKQNEVYLSFIQNNAERESELSEMDQRKNSLKTALENDLSFAPYYTSLLSFLNLKDSESTPSSSLISMDFSENYTSTLSFSSKDYESHINLIELLESEESSSLFEWIRTNGTIYIRSEEQEAQSYQLNAEVQFTPQENENL